MEIGQIVSCVFQKLKFMNYETVMSGHKHTNNGKWQCRRKLDLIFKFQ